MKSFSNRLVVLAFSAVALARGGFAAAQDSEDVLIADPRPLAVAVRQFEQRCRCVVSYEDAKWGDADVADAALLGRRPSSAPHMRIPTGQPFTFAVHRRLASEMPAQREQSLRDLLKTFEDSHNPGHFRLVIEGSAYQVVPVDGSVLDARVTLVPTERSLGEAIGDVLRSVSRSTGEQVVLGVAPLNFWLQQRITLDAREERAGSVLARALASTGRQMSWQLLYDFDDQRYYLNVYFVE